MRSSVSLEGILFTLWLLVSVKLLFLIFNLATSLLNSSIGLKVSYPETEQSQKLGLFSHATVWEKYPKLAARSEHAPD